MRAKLTIGADGEIAVPARQADGLGLPRGGDVDVVTAPGAFSLVVPASGDAGRAFFAGSLASLTVPEIVQFIIASLKSGVLQLVFEDGARRGARVNAPARVRRKSIHFRDGQVVFASSSEPADRLGSVLVRNGLVVATEIERCASLADSARPLGQVLVDEGVITSGQLYEGITAQVREIFLSAFVETAGEFAFLEGVGDQPNEVKLPERARDLVLEGMKRVEEAEARRAAEGPGDEFAAAEAPVEELQIDEVRATAIPATPVPDDEVLAAGVPGDEVLGIEVEGSWTPDAGLPGADEPVAAGHEEVEIEIEAPAATPPPAPGVKPRVKLPGSAGPFETYRRIFKRVHDAIVAVDPKAGTRFDSWFERLPEKRRAVFEGVRIDGDGYMDVAQVLANVEAGGQYKGAAARARSLEALEELLAFALFEAKNRLPKAEAERLLREVGRMQVGKA